MNAQTPWPLGGGARRRVTFDLDDLGALVLTSHVTGTGPAAAWGADDEEVTVRIPARAASALALSCLRRLLGGRPDAAGALVALCEADNISFETAHWT